jgi:hypothetical protein
MEDLTNQVVKKEDHAADAARFLFENEMINIIGKKNDKSLIFSALVKAQKEFGPALKLSSNPHFRSKYSDLASVVDAVIDGLNNNGIFLSANVKQAENGIIVETIFLHESGQVHESGCPVFVPVDKNNAHGYGSALTYARRYSLMTACGVAPEDDDGNAAVQAIQKPKSVAKVENIINNDFLNKLREAATGGLDELKKERESLLSVNKQDLSNVWVKHGDELKAIATKADEEGVKP